MTIQRLHSHYAVLGCDNCKWSGEVSECPRGFVTSEDVVWLLCPKCRTPLAFQGGTSLNAIVENAIVLDDGLITK